MAGMVVEPPRDNTEELRRAKAELRRRMVQLLQAVPAERLAADSARIAQHVLGLPLLGVAQSVFCFISMPGEVETRDLIRQLLQRGKTVAVPLIVERGKMEAHRIDDLTDCAPGAFGIMAPRSPNPLAAAPDVCLTPGLAFTVRGDRLGRGAGYYDRFLAERPAMTSVALGLDEQVVEQIPMGPNDHRVSMIVTPSLVVRREKS
jgi:5-formyltetrahydrofolate cyclo-ligase